MAGWRQMPKQTFYNIVECSYRDGIGARRLSRLLGYSPTHIRIAARALGLPKLPRWDQLARPSQELLGMIEAVEHFRIYRWIRLCVNESGKVRPE